MGETSCETIRNDIEELNELINGLTDCFYQQKITEGYSKLEVMYPKLILIIDEIGLLEKNNDIVESINNITDILNNTLQVLEKKDYILLSDILKYDLMAELKYLSNKLA